MTVDGIAVSEQLSGGSAHLVFPSKPAAGKGGFMRNKQLMFLSSQFWRNRNKLQSSELLFRVLRHFYKSSLVVLPFFEAWQTDMDLHNSQMLGLHQRTPCRLTLNLSSLLKVISAVVDEWLDSKTLTCSLPSSNTIGLWLRLFLHLILIHYAYFSLCLSLSGMSLKWLTPFIGTIRWQLLRVTIDPPNITCWGGLLLLSSV